MVEDCRQGETVILVNIANFASTRYFSKPASLNEMFAKGCFEKLDKMFDLGRLWFKLVITQVEFDAGHNLDAFPSFHGSRPGGGFSRGVCAADNNFDSFVE